MSEAKIILPYNYTPRPYQLPLWSYMDSPNPSKRAVCVWHRRSGKDINALHITIKKMLERPGLYWHVLPTYNQGKKIVWEGMTADGKRFLDAFPKDLVAGEPNSTEMKVRLKNGALWQVVGTDDPNRLVGTNPVGIVFSEYSLQDSAAYEYTRPILAENGGWAIFIYTPRGKNHGYSLLNQAKKNPAWFHSVLTVDDTQAISQAALKQEEQDMAPEVFRQEYYCSFEAPLQGAYYADGMMLAERDGRITNVPWEQVLPVHTAWDLGVDDSTTIWFFQQHHNKICLIDYESFSGEGLPRCAKILSQKPYSYGIHYAPHDIEVREFSANGLTRRQIARSLGLNFRPGKRRDLMEGIEAVRAIMNKCWFDEKKCDKGIESLREYSKKYDEKNKIFMSTPMHNHASHGADAFRELAWNVSSRPFELDDFNGPKKNAGHKNCSNYDPFTWGKPKHSTAVA